ncbi:N-acetyltransferase domain-containing protein [Mycena kentingensis (nom. inval.)]|nr:N-acetyltransferase domain-containing protein [Mycena kentingensis (nom. inval.)]
MHHDHHHPLESHPKTGEPILRLQVLKHPNIILTPPRLSDASAIVPLLTATSGSTRGLAAYRIHIISVPDAEWWLSKVVPLCDALLAKATEAESQADKILFDGCPTRIIRELHDDGTDTFLGDICIDLAGHWWELEGSGLTTQPDAPRRSSDPNDLDIWTIGDYLAPSYHRRGIVSDALQTLITQWAVPRMGVRRMVVTTLKGNKASVGVFEKHGFVFRKMIEDALDVRGVSTSVHVLEWGLLENR